MGVDLAVDMLVQARAKISKNSWSHLQVMEMDALNLAFADNSFDYVTAFHTVTVVPDPVQMLAEAKRVCRPGGKIVIVNIRASVQSALDRPDIAIASVAHDAQALKGRRPLYFGTLGRFVEAPVYDRAGLPTGFIVDGPALIEEAASTLLLPPGARAVTEANGNIVVTLGQPTEVHAA